MTGKYVFYPLGVDDNGLPTEKLVEKSLESELTLLQLGSEKLIIESLL